MANRYPLVAISTEGKIKELPIGDNLDLGNSSIVGAAEITANTFYGNLSGLANYSGYADVAGIATTAIYLNNASNILDGTISPGRLSGDYNINITGVAASATTVASFSNFTDANGTILTDVDSIIRRERLSGYYDITITGTSNTSGFAQTSALTQSVNISIANTPAVLYPTLVSGIGSQSVSIGLSSLTYIPATTRLGIGATTPLYNLDVRGDVSFDGILYAPTTITVGITTGTFLGSNSLAIGVNTTGLLINDYLVDDPQSTIYTNTQITSIGIGSIGISTNHVGANGAQRSLVFTRKFRVHPGQTNNVLVSRGSTLSAYWVDPSVLSRVNVTAAPDASGYNLVLTPTSFGQADLVVDNNGLTYNSSTNLITGTITTSRNVVGGIVNVDSLTAGVSNKVTITEAGRVGIGSTTPTTNLDVNGTVSAINFLGSGANLAGIVTQLTAGIGVNLTPAIGQGVVKIESYAPIGKTIFVSQTGDDDNSGLAINYPKRTIKAAAVIAFPGDTIKVFPGVYVENNPIVLARAVSVEGTELRNCIVTPRYTDRDLFYTNNGVHITDLSFIGPDMSNGAAIVSLQPLLGVATDRFFDAARMIRMNLDYIAKESVGFLTSGFSGFAGTHREQDAARLIDLNLNYIAAEAVGFLTSPSGYNFTSNEYTNTNCKEDIVSIFSAVSYDLKANSNRKSVGAALSYFNSSGALQYISGVTTAAATIATLNYAVGIAKSVINNVGPTSSYQSGIGSILQIKDASVISVVGGCVGVGTTIAQLVGIVTTAIGLGNTSLVPTGTAIRYGVTLESDKCASDVKSIWKCVINDITRGGNTSCVAAGKSYYDSNFNLIPSILKNPAEIPQTIGTLEYSFGVARAIINNSTWGSYPVGLGTTVTNAVYSNTTGLTTITATNHGLVKDNAVKIVGLSFTCTSGGTVGTAIYPSGNLGYVFNVHRVVGVNTFEVVVGQSTLPHTYKSGGTVQKYTNFQNNATQIKDLSMQIDPDTKYNNAINGCSNVVSAIRSCVGIVTTIVGLGAGAFKSLSNPTGITTSYSGNLGIGFTSVIGITSAVYNNATGNLTLLAPGLYVKSGDVLEVRDLKFSCNSGGGISTQTFPSGKYGYEFYVNKVNTNDTFVINVGVSTLAHNYVNGGFIVKRSIGITTVSYNNVTGIATITANGAYVKVGDIITLIGLGFTCPSGPGIVTYPSGNLGYNFPVTQVIGSAGTTFVVNVGTSTLPHTYVSGGIVKPAYSRGVGPITQGPYIRNCTNFIGKSIGLKVDGFNAEPGDKEDIGVTGTMSVDSYTQYNQGGIGVSITNGGYAQLVSIFTICDDIAIYTASGGQCDITNSNSSFGNYGLYSTGISDPKSKSIYRSTGVAVTDAIAKSNTIIVSGVGANRPYDGQSCYFGQLYYALNTISITNPGSGYISAPKVTITSPEGSNGITAQASSTIDANGTVIAVNILNAGTQYIANPSVTIDGPGGGGVTATAEVTNMQPIYYYVSSATLPSAGISTVSFLQTLNNTVSAGTTIYFARKSSQLASTISFEYVGAGTNISTAKPALGGIVIPENKVVQLNGGTVTYTSTDQSGNFNIGDGVTVNQATGQISGRDFTKALFTTLTPFILALSD